jgi:hypothetical protein
MKILNRIAQGFNAWFGITPEPVVNSTPAECKHDWETIRCWDMEDVARDTDGITDVDGSYGIHSYWISFHYMREFYHVTVPTGKRYASDKVCLNCGECIKGVKEAKTWLLGKVDAKMTAEKEKAERKRLAKRMWKDCKNE